MTSRSVWTTFTLTRCSRRASVAHREVGVAVECGFFFVRWMLVLHTVFFSIYSCRSKCLLAERVCSCGCGEIRFLNIICGRNQEQTDIIAYKRLMMTMGRVCTSTTEDLTCYRCFHVLLILFSRLISKFPTLQVIKRYVPIRICSKTTSISDSLGH